MDSGSSLKKTALIVEGGGMRGIFTAGILDTFIEEQFDPFDMYFGVSSGALNLSSHLAGQYGRNYTVITKYGTDPAFIKMRNLWKGGHVMDLDWMFEICQKEYPVDIESAVQAIEGKQFWMVSTDILTGEAVYFEPNLENWEACAKASSTLPLFYRGEIYVDGRRYMDGGLSDPIPVQEAYQRGAKRIVILRTRPYSYRKKKNAFTYLNAYLYRQFPAFRERVMQHANTYNQTLDFIDTPPQDLEIIHVAPEAPLVSSRTTKNIKSLDQDYQLGKEIGKQVIEKFSTLQLRTQRK